jgi:hypothetical protein
LDLPKYGVRRCFQFGHGFVRFRVLAKAWDESSNEYEAVNFARTRRYQILAFRNCANPSNNEQPRRHEQARAGRCAAGFEDQPSQIVFVRRPIFCEILCWHDRCLVRAFPPIEFRRRIGSGGKSA